MRNERGFTLIETMIAMAVLVPSLVAVAMLFPQVINTNMSSRQTAVATIVVGEKMEVLRSLPLNHASLAVGGGLDPTSPVTNYHDYVTVANNGVVTASLTSSRTAYLRLWQVTGTNPKTITVVVHSVRNAMSRRSLEAARASTMVTDTFR